MTEAEQQEIISDIQRLVRGLTDRVMNSFDRATPCGDREFLECLEYEMVELIVQIIDTHTRLPVYGAQFTNWLDNPQ